MNWLFLLLTTTTFAAPQAKYPEQNAYEAITGDSADEDRAFWDTFYKQKDFAFGKDAVSFLRENIQKIPKGKAFVPAMGEGRNAIFLAKHGFDVSGNDISEIAIDKALLLSKKAGVTIKASVADLKEYKFIDQQFDFIFISLFYDKTLIPGLKKSLKKGGFIMFYEEIYDGDPKKAKSLFWVKTKELEETFKDFKLIQQKTYNENGKKMVGLLAQKN